MRFRWRTPQRAPCAGLYTMPDSTALTSCLDAGRSVLGFPGPGDLEAASQVQNALIDLLAALLALTAQLQQLVGQVQRTHDRDLLGRTELSGLPDFAHAPIEIQRRIHQSTALFGRTHDLVFAVEDAHRHQFGVAHPPAPSSAFRRSIMASTRVRASSLRWTSPARSATSASCRSISDCFSRSSSATRDSSVRMLVSMRSSAWLSCSVLMPARSLEIQSNDRAL